MSINNQVDFSHAPLTEEHVIEEDEEDEIDSQDDIDDNDNMEEGDDEPLFDIARVNNTEIEYEQDPLDVFTSDQWIDEAMMNNSHEEIDVPCTLEGEEPHGHLITIVAIVANQDIIEVHVQGYNPLITIKMDQLPGPVDTFVLYAQDSHRSQLVYASQETEVLKYWEHHRSLGNSVPLMYLPLLEDFDRASRYSWGGATLGYLYRQLSIACKSDAKAIYGLLTLLQMWHRRTDYIIPPDEETVGIGRVEYMSWYWSITRRYIGRPGFTCDMRYEPRDHIERSLVQRTDSSTLDARPSEPCAGTPQQPDDAGPPQFSPDVMTVSQYGASQLLTDEGMPDTQPPQSTVDMMHM
ncbi:hypothetical protein Taro_028842 [Colocasia esculenta]|uniref:Aminotransferase-like plant mobile domain-containing protein n=1 Tax=Colocasia esculenta TaxID=4460 RepID=A0A843VIA9_COLES|nr:hypothetical protein [Colocasia esculenta]